MYDRHSRSNSVKAYQTEPTILEVKNIPYFDAYKDEFIESNYTNIYKVEVLLVLYRITPTG